jgi:hypothetical protein
MSPADAVPIALLLLFGTALGIGGAIVLLACRWNRRAAARSPLHRLHPVAGWPVLRRFRPLAKRPTAWLAIRNRDPAQVLDALSLSDPTPCSWNDGLAGENRHRATHTRMGVAAGTAVPDPADDVDAVFASP